MNSPTLKDMSFPRKTVSLVTCGAIVVGAILHLGILSILPNYVLQDAANTLHEQTSYSIETQAEFTQKIEEDKRFITIEKDLKPWGGIEISEELDPESSAVEQLKQKASSGFLYPLYPLVPGYANYMQASEASDANAPISTKVSSRGALWAEFKNTCNMVDDLNAGLNLKDIGITRADENGYEVSAYRGKYSFGAGITPENFETNLKGCGDKNLKYLAELKEQNRIWEADKTDTDMISEEK